MQDIMINQNKWKEFFDNFSKRNRSRLVSVEIFDDLGAQKEVKKMPLSGIVFETGGKNSLSLDIMFENRRAGEASHLTHIIPNVQSVFPKRDLNGRDESLEVEDADGNKTLLIFEQLPELGAGAFYATAHNRLW